MQKTLINICGSERSGSTMLDLIIGNEPRAFSCGEIYALYRPWRKHHFQPGCGCGRQDCEYLEEFRRVSEDQFHSLLFEKFGYDWIVDSSKDLTWVVDNQQWITQKSGRVLNLVIWKKPTTFSISFLKRGKDANYWRKIFMDYYKKFLEAELPFVSVCYDDFVNEPRKYLGLISDLLGMENFDGKMNFWEKKHHQLFGSGGTGKQVLEGASEIFRQVEYPPQFEKDIKLIEASLDNDAEVTAIIDELRQREISLLNVSQKDPFNYDRPGKKPPWYYKQKIALKIRRYFPESYQQRGKRRKTRNHQ